MELSYSKDENQSKNNKNDCLFGVADNNDALICNQLDWFQQFVLNLKVHTWSAVIKTSGFLWGEIQHHGFDPKTVTSVSGITGRKRN